MSKENLGILSNLFGENFVCREAYQVYTREGDAYGSCEHHGSDERNMVDFKDEISSKGSD